MGSLGACNDKMARKGTPYVMIKQSFIGALRRVRVQPRWLVAIGISTVFVLSIFHHTVNFWGLSWEKQLLIGALIPALSVPINFLVAFTWKRTVSISWKRWLLFLLPAMLIASYLTWRVFESPVVWHSLQVTARENSGRTQVQLLEIRDSNGAVVRFSQIQDLGDWSVQNKILTAGGSDPVRYSFLGPFRSPVKVRFLTSPDAGDVEIKVDGKSVEASLFENGNGQSEIQIDPTYRFGISGMAMNQLVTVIDFLTFLLLFTILWLAQEIQQTVQPAIESSDPFSRRAYWKWLGILLVLSFVLHAANYFSAPLNLGEDSPGYLDGAVHWAKYRNLEGASNIRGPGTSFLFLPAILLFGRNPWGLKLLLHLLAFASVALTYHLGWQLTRKYWFAFFAGLLTALNPDILLYSNFVMSEVPNIFVVLLFCILLLTALETLSFRSILAAMLVGSFAVLIRTENLVLLLMTVLFLWVRVIQKLLAQRQVVPLRYLFRQMAVPARYIGVSLLLAVLPPLAWSAHNYQQHGFFGLSNYAPEVFYTGWVYEGEASRIPITDQSSPAVQIISNVYSSDPTLSQDAQVQTGWMIYLNLVDHGYTSEEAFSILRQAALDSITRDYRLTWQVIVIKIRDSFKPEPTQMLTFPLPGEATSIDDIKSMYFDEEKLVIPSLILIQRRIYEFLAWYYVSIYPIWAWFCLGATLFCLYRKPVIPWLPIVLITLFRVGLPNIFGLSLWRFVIPGLPLMQILALAALQSIYLFARSMFDASRNEVAYSLPVKAMDQDQA